MSRPKSTWVRLACELNKDGAALRESLSEAIAEALVADFRRNPGPHLQLRLGPEGEATETHG